MPLRELKFQQQPVRAGLSSEHREPLCVVVCPSLKQLCQPDSEAECDAWKDVASLPAVKSIYIHIPVDSHDLVSNYIRDSTSDGVRRNADDLLSELKAVELPTCCRIIFVGYSFGSTIVKDAVGCCRENPGWRSLFDQTIHIIFVDAVNNPSDAEFDTAFFRSASCELGTLVKRKHLAVFKNPSFLAQMKTLCQQFDGSICHYHSTSYSGSEKTVYRAAPLDVPGLDRFSTKQREQIIPKSLATLTGSSHRSIELQCDHDYMSAFTTPESILGNKIREIVEHIAKNPSVNSGYAAPAPSLHSFAASTSRYTRGKLSQRDTATGAPQSIRSQIAFSYAKLPCFYVRPYQKNPAFTGRDAILSKLRNVLEPGKEPGQQSKMALIGVPGVGKTQIALQYAFESIEHKIFEIILFGQAETRAKLANSFVNFDEELGLQRNGRSNSQAESRERVKKFLQCTVKWSQITDVQGDKRWLLIFDNLEKLDSDLGDFWPTGDRGSVLITARSESVLGPLFRLSGTINDVSGLDVQDSASLLFKITGLRKVDARQPYAKTIHERIGGHPLALTTIASMIYSKKMDLKEYVEIFPNVRLFDESKSISTLEAQYSHSLSDAFKTALSGIEAGVRHGTAWSFLELLSFLDPDSVVEQDLRDASTCSKHPTLTGIADSRKFEENRSLLCEHNAINRNTELRTLLMHRMVQDYCHYKMTTESAQNAFSGAVELLRNLWPVPERHNRHQPALWPTQERLANHVVSLANHWKISQEFRHGQCLHADVSFAELLYNAGWYFYERGNFPSALPLLQIAEAYCKDHPENCQIILADVYGAYGGRASECNDAQACFDNFSKQQEHIQKAIKLGFLARPNIREAHAEGGIGVGNMALKKFAEAKQAFRKCLEIWKDCPGDPSIYVPHLGVCLTLQGKLEEADSLLSSIIEQRAREFGERDRTSFRTGIIYLAYGNLQIYQKRFDEAYRTHLFAAEMLAETVGDNHHRYADACYKVGWHQLRRGEFEAAEEKLTRALTIYQASPVFKNEEARVLFILGEVALKQNKMEDAKTTRDQAEGIRRMIFKNEHIGRGSEGGSEEDYDDSIMFWSR